MVEFQLDIPVYIYISGHLIRQSLDTKNKSSSYTYPKVLVLCDNASQMFMIVHLQMAHGAEAYS